MLHAAHVRIREAVDLAEPRPAVATYLGNGTVRPTTKGRTVPCRPDGGTYRRGIHRTGERALSQPSSRCARFTDRPENGMTPAAKNSMTIRQVGRFGYVAV